MILFHLRANRVTAGVGSLDLMTLPKECCLSMRKYLSVGKWVAILSLLVAPEIAAQTEIYRDSNKGLPADADRIVELTHEEAVDKIKARFAGAFDDLASQYKTTPYSSVASRVAVAACLSPRPDVDESSTQPWLILNWAQFEIKTDMHDAEQKSLKACQDYTGPRQGGNCRCVQVLSGTTLSLPETYVDSYIREKRNQSVKRANSFAMASKTIVLSESLDAAKSARHTGPKDLVLHPNYPVTLGYPDSERDYDQACLKRIYYSWSQVPDQMVQGKLQELEELSNKGIYGCYLLSIDTIGSPQNMWPGDKMDHECRFTAEIPGVSKLEPFSPESKSWLREAFPDEELQRVWAQGVAKATVSGVPVQVLDRAEPLAIQNSKGLFVATRLKISDPGFGCYVGAPPFKNKVLHINRHSAAPLSTERIVSLLLSRLEESFKKDPLGATRDSSEQPPGEMVMERPHKKSLVLGEPMFESSSYLFRVWNADEDSPWMNAYGRTQYKGDAKMQNIYLEVRDVINLSPNALGKFMEIDNPKDEEKFRTSVNDAVAKAVKEACSSLSGTTINGVCEVAQQ